MSKYVNKSLPKEQRLGQVGVNNQGEKIVIIRYSKLEGQNKTTIDVQFEDGVIVYNKLYSNFVKGAIKHPIRYEESFAYHIIEELGIDLDLIWNWEKNNANGINPYEIYKSCKTKVWLYCLENEEHNYDKEGNKIGYEINCNNFYCNKSRCSYCASKKIHWKDSLAYNYPQVARMISEVPKNKTSFEDCYSIGYGSRKSFYFKCLDCGTISNKKYTLYQITYYGFSCKHCSDGLPTTEKFMANILKQLNVDFKTQLNEADFNWCNRRYDFYIPYLSMILEINGGQHYEETTRGRSLKEEQANDRYNKHLAKKNGIKRYYTIDCRKSELEYMKNNIIKTLGHLFDLSNIDWELAWEKSQNSLCVEAWKLYDKYEIKDVTKISEILNIDYSVTLNYLKRGAECGKCSYSVEESKKRGYKKMSETINGTAVICKFGNNIKIFKKITHGINYFKRYNLNLGTSNISKCCNGNRNYCGKLSNGTKLVWRYLVIDHNIMLRGKDISKLHSKSNQKIV